MQWEYLHSTVTKWPEIDIAMNQAGLEGWELVAVVPNITTKQLTHTLYFKRPLKPSHS
jgi:hypothetical protein